MTTTTNTTAKVTSKDFYNAFIALANGEQISLTPEQVTEWCNKKIEQLARKSASGTGKLTKNQEANEVTKGIILDVLRENGGFMTISEIQSANEALADLKNQKMSALLRQLGVDGSNQVEKKIEKRVTYFKAM